MNPLQLLLLSLALIAGASVTSLNAQQIEESSTIPTAAQSTSAQAKPDNKGPSTQGQPGPAPQESRVDDLEARINKVEQSLQPGPLDIAWPLWIAAAPGIAGVILSLSAFIEMAKQGSAIQGLSRRNQNLLSRIGGLEVQIEQDRQANRRMAMAAQAPKTAPPPQQHESSNLWSNPLGSQQPESPTIQPLERLPNPQPALVSEPEGLPNITSSTISKTGLINALNAGDRQSLRDAATAELNITSESENALAMGRSIATELEEVNGGGSYWLVNLQGQHWLFPTDRTLRGFAAAQPAKGLFIYVQMTIAQPQLMEPALLERSGNRWVVQSMGRISTT
jgi:hypothetical protein